MIRVRRRLGRRTRKELRRVHAQRSVNCTVIAGSFGSGLSRVQVALKYGITVEQVDLSLRRILIRMRAGRAW